MQEILIPALVLTATVLGLSLLVLLARHLVGMGGIVTVTVDGGPGVKVQAGRRLLWALADAGIRLPAACGGKGACGQCRVRIDAGCPPLSLMGANHIGPVEARAGHRLACMVRVWDDMRVAVGSGTAAGHWQCEVASSRNISVYLKELVLRLPGDERIAFEAGDYVQVDVPPYRLDFADIHVDAPFDREWERLGLFHLRSSVTEPTVRAYSMANPPQQDRELRLVVRIATPPPTAPVGTPPGRASSYLFSLQPGDRVGVSGPFGEFNATDGDAEMVFIAGGAGIAPIRSIIMDQLARRVGRRMSLWFGARDLNDLCYYDEFLDLADGNENFKVQAVLSEPRAEDRWTGATGFVHAVVLEKYLKHHPAPGAAEYYLCGPPLMTSAVLQMLEGLGVARDHVFLDDFGA